MGGREPTAAFRDVRALFGVGAAGGASDEQLLDRFRARGDNTSDAEMAFAVLVARHGPMVLGVCRRALHDPNDAADAFQATFLILVRKADSVRVEGSLGRWLYLVSRRVANRARAVTLRHACRERAVSRAEPHAFPDDIERRELLTALDEEVAKLPDPFRSAVVLCDLGGLTHEDAAKQLGCPVGTIESRLSRARKRLRDQLTRRGLAPTVAATGAFDVALPVVPDLLSATTVAVAMRTAEVSASILSLMEGALADMFWTHAKTLTLSLGAAAIAGALAVVTAQALKADNDPPSAPPVANVANATNQTTEIHLEPPRKVQPGDMLRLEVLEALPARPLRGERVVRPDGTVSLGFYGNLKVAGLNRTEIKIQLIKHLRTYLTDDALGLWKEDPDHKNKPMAVAPADSSCVFVDESPTYQPDSSTSPTASKEPARMKPGDLLQIEVLEALPGRSITGERIVRADGTISLGFYGDLKVVGLNRHEIKINMIKHLSKFLSKDVLGLFRAEETDDGKERLIDVAPGDSDRVFVDDSANYRSPSLLPIAPAAGPILVKPGDILLIEVLEALPGRPIVGERLVRPDGTISLDFYGDLKVAGLTRDQIKVKVIEHLRKHLDDEVLGLVVSDPQDETKTVKVAPIDSDRVYVDESGNMYREMGHQKSRQRAKAESSETAQRLIDFENRLRNIEKVLNLMEHHFQKPKEQPKTENFE